MRRMILFSLLGIAVQQSEIAAQSPFGRTPVPGGGGNFGGFGAPFAPSTPTFSPYLNLLRGGNSTALNYYGLVRPEQQFRQAVQGIDQQLGDLSQLTTGNNQAAGIVTGSRARFQNTGGYFLSNSSSSGGGGGAFVLTTPIQSPLSQSIQIGNPNLRPNLGTAPAGGGGPGRRGNQ